MAGGAQAASVGRVVGVGACVYQLAPAAWPVVGDGAGCEAGRVAVLVVWAAAAGADAEGVAAEDAGAEAVFVGACVAASAG